MSLPVRAFGKKEWQACRPRVRSAKQGRAGGLRRRASLLLASRCGLAGLLPFIFSERSTPFARVRKTFGRMRGPQFEVTVCTTLNCTVGDGTMRSLVFCDYSQYFATVWERVPARQGEARRGSADTKVPKPPHKSPFTHLPGTGMILREILRLRRSRVKNRIKRKTGLRLREQHSQAVLILILIALLILFLILIFLLILISFIFHQMAVSTRVRTLSLVTFLPAHLSGIAGKRV